MASSPLLSVTTGAWNPRIGHFLDNSTADDEQGMVPVLTSRVDSGREVVIPPPEKRGRPMSKVLLVGLCSLPLLMPFRFFKPRKDRPPGGVRGAVCRTLL
jgi:hypothetical protein